MIYTQLFHENASSIRREPQPGYHPFNTFGRAYSIASASPDDLSSTLENLYFLDNSLFIHKYYPKGAASMTSFLKRPSEYPRSRIKLLRHLKTIHLYGITGSIKGLKSLELLTSESKDRDYTICLKKTMLTAKDLKTFKTKAPLKEKTLKNLVCLKRLRSLEINLNDKQLQVVGKSILRLPALENITIIFSTFDRHDLNIRDPHQFLTFCEELLTKKTLKGFKIAFNCSYGHYTTETFERLFKSLEKSKVGQWNIQALLSEDQVLKIAETYDVFKQAEFLAIHTSSIMRSCRNGMRSDYSSFHKTVKVREKQQKSLDIYLLRSMNQRTKPFDLQSVLKHCPKLECLFIEWTHSPFTHTISTSSTSKGYQSLKTIYLNMKFHTPEENWQHLLQILENAPFLEKVYLAVNELQASSEYESEIFNPIEACTKKLMRIKTLKSLDISPGVLTQRSMDAFQSLFETLSNLTNLTFSLAYSTVYGLTIPKIPFENMAELTEVRVCLPYSAEASLNNLNSAVAKLSNLSILEFKNYGKEPVSWYAFFELMKKLRKLTLLSLFTFQSRIGIDSSEDGVERTRQEVNKLSIQCQTLESIQISFIDLANIDYIKYFHK